MMSISHALLLNSGREASRFTLKDIVYLFQNNYRELEIFAQQHYPTLWNLLSAVAMKANDRSEKIFQLLVIVPLCMFVFFVKIYF